MPSSLAQKLQIKSGKLIVMNAPKGYAEQLTKELKDLTVSKRAAGQAEAVLLFVNKKNGTRWGLRIRDRLGHRCRT